MHVENINNSWVSWWLRPVIQALWEAEMGGSTEVRSLRLPWPTWWNPVCTKNTKISWVWWQAPVVPATWEVEAVSQSLAVSQDCSHCTPPWVTEWYSISKKKKCLILRFISLLFSFQSMNLVLLQHELSFKHLNCTMLVNCDGITLRRMQELTRLKDQAANKISY